MTAASPTSPAARSPGTPVTFPTSPAASARSAGRIFATPSSPATPARSCRTSTASSPASDTTSSASSELHSAIRRSCRRPAISSTSTSPRSTSARSKTMAVRRRRAPSARAASRSTSDQRGLTRPCDGASIPNATGGDGGDVGAYEEQLACVSNANPDAVDDNASVAEDSGANAIDVLANDTDANADVLTIISVTQGAHGSVAITGGGTGVSYTPASNYFGPD